MITGHHNGRPKGKLRDIELEPVAEIDVPEITFQWFDHVLKGKPRPKLIKDKINYQLMGANQWHSASSLQDLNAQGKGFYFNPQGKLVNHAPQSDGFNRQTVNFADRETENSYYPWPIKSATRCRQKMAWFTYQSHLKRI